MNRSGEVAVSAGLIVATVFLGALSPAYAVDEQSATDGAIETIQSVSTLDSIGPNDVRVTDDGLEASISGLRIEVPEDAENGIVFSANDSAVTIDLPFANQADAAATVGIAGVAAYDNHNSSVTVPAIRSDGSLQISTVIESSSAPHEYSYPISIPDGLPLIIGDQGDVSATPPGSMIPMVYIAPPWAKDARGNPVATHYRVNGDTLTQVVEFTDQTAFPIVADPAAYVDTTSATVINVSRQGTIPRWQYLNGCSASKGRTCSVSRTYTVTASTQTSLGVSKSIISGSIGVTDGQSIAVAATCGVPNGPGTATLYAQAEKTLYQVKTVRRWGVPTAGGGSMHTETKVSGWLEAYKPNGRFSCM